MTINHDDLNFFDYLLYSDEAEEEEDDEDVIILFLATAAENHYCSSCYVRDRLEWDNHLATLFEQGPMALYHQLHYAWVAC